MFNASQLRDLGDEQLRAVLLHILQVMPDTRETAVCFLQEGELPAAAKDEFKDSRRRASSVDNLLQRVRSGRERVGRRRGAKQNGEGGKKLAGLGPCPVLPPHYSFGSHTSWGGLGID
jgi:hypothetical protein